MNTPLKNTAMTISTETLRILNPHEGIYAYYDGRTDKRLHSEQPNWLDDGAYTLGTASYAIICDDHALVYDTHMSLDHASAIRRHLESLGVRIITVVLSHWHADHIAGNAIFADCEIIALSLTARTMQEKRAELESDEPPIVPVIMPTRLFDRYLSLTVGTKMVELHHFDIHSADGNILWLPEDKILFAGDTLEDTVTYISEPDHIPTHIEELKRLGAWKIERILPNHGADHVIASGGYEPGLIGANRAYLERLSTPQGIARAQDMSLKDFVAGELEDGAIIYHAHYEAVHRHNVEAVKRARTTTPQP